MGTSSERVQVQKKVRAGGMHWASATRVRLAILFNIHKTHKSEVAQNLERHQGHAVMVTKHKTFQNNIIKA